MAEQRQPVAQQRRAILHVRARMAQRIGGQHLDRLPRLADVGHCNRVARIADDLHLVDRHRRFQLKMRLLQVRRHQMPFADQRLDAERRDVIDVDAAFARRDGDEGIFVGQVRVVVFGWRRFPAAVQRIAGRLPLAVVVHVGLQRREITGLPSGNMPFTCLTL